MRVIAGTAAGTRLVGPTTDRVRPILDRVKESLFSILGGNLEGAVVLDLFAGVGSLGIEALSRGAAHSDFIEVHRPTARRIRENLKRTHLLERADVYVARLPSGLRIVKGPYSLIFADPPFRIDKRSMEELFRFAGDRGLLEEDGLLVYRHSPRSFYEPREGEWSLSLRRDYGDSIISIFSYAVR